MTKMTQDAKEWYNVLWVISNIQVSVLEKIKFNLWVEAKVLPLGTICLKADDQSICEVSVKGFWQCSVPCEGIGSDIED